MRKHIQGVENVENNSYRIIAVDDEEGIVDSLSIFLKRSGYDFTGVTDPQKAIELVKQEHFDLMILDFIMTPFHGDQVVEEIRKFNKDLYILLLTGHKDLAPPLETIKRLDIQGYCEKSDKFDQLLLLIESGIKSIKQMNEIKEINEKLSDTYEKLEQAYLDSIKTLRYTIEAKDMYTRGHSDRVAAYSVLIGKKLGLSDEDLHTLEIGGLFHDIGKIGVPDSVLLKEAKLTDEEYSQIGRLAGNDIPYLARIATIADSFDAMASRRAYRNSLDLDTIIKNLKVCPANMNLAGAEVELVSMMSREQRLKEKVDIIKEKFDYVFIDCPPSLGLITLNAFTASNSVLIPVQCEYFALEGLGQLLNTINLVKKHLNKEIRIEGALLTMYDIRTNLSNQVVKEVKKYFENKVYKTVIPRNVRLSEAPSYGMPITEYDPRSKGAKSYIKFAKEFLKINEEEKKAKHMQE